MTSSHRERRVSDELARRSRKGKATAALRVMPGNTGALRLYERLGFRRAEVVNTVEGVGYELHIQIPEEPSMHFCLTGVQVTEVGSVPTGMSVKVLPPCTYAVFTHRVVEGYAKVYQSINAWLESSEYSEAHPYDFQLYDSRFTSMDDPESVQDIYVPVRLE